MYIHRNKVTAKYLGRSGKPTDSPREALILASKAKNQSWEAEEVIWANKGQKVVAETVDGVDVFVADLADVHDVELLNMIQNICDEVSVSWDHGIPKFGITESDLSISRLVIAETLLGIFLDRIKPKTPGFALEGNGA